MVNVSTSIGRDFGKKSPDFLEPVVRAAKQREATFCHAQTQQKEVAHKMASVRIPASLGFGVFLFSFFPPLCVWMDAPVCPGMSCLPELPP